MLSDLERASALVVDLHRFFTEWISGACEKRADLLIAGVSRHFARDFIGITARGTVMTPGSLDRWMNTVHGSSPAFRIAIRNVAVRQRIETALVVSYEEWQHDAMEPPRTNARVSTMVMRDCGERLEIVHLHETWLPDEAVTGGEFAF